MAQPGAKTDEAALPSWRALSRYYGDENGSGMSCLITRDATTSSATRSNERLRRSTQQSACGWQYGQGEGAQQRVVERLRAVCGGEE